MPSSNAAGRLENAERALHLLLAKTIEEAEPIARELDAQNRERQQIERRIADEVIGALKARVDANCFAIVEGQMLWHIGVVGIVASRVLREFYRPTIILGGDAESWRGSGRSIEGFDLAEALRDCSDLLLRHGGHALAAGLSIKEQNLEAFRQRLNLLARQRLKPEQLRPLLQLDAEVKLGDLTLELLRCLRQLGPHGQGNPEVQLLVRKVRLQRPPQCVGKDQQHVKWRVTDGQVLFEALWWNGAEAPQPSGHFDLAFIPQINEYNGSLSVQLKVLDWREPA
jgi:single-stranded-DNA-specific exonuclease